MQLALAFFFGCRGQIAAGKAISQQLDVIGQRNVRAAAVGGVHNLHTDRHDGVVLAIHVRERSSRAVRIQKCSIKRHLLERIITDAAVIFIAPALNADFGFTNQYRQAIGIQIISGRLLRQAGVHLMPDLVQFVTAASVALGFRFLLWSILIRGFIGCFRGCGTVGIAFGFCFLRCRLFRRCDHNRSCAVLRQCPIGEHTAAHHRRHAKGCNALPHFEFVIHCTQVLSLSKFIYIKTAPVGTDAGKPIKSPGIAAGKSYYTNCHLVGKVAEKLRKFCFRQCFHDSQRHVLRATDCRQELPRIDFAYAGTADITDHPFFA